MKPLISIIAAVAENGVIGRNNALPWRLPADLRRVRQLTTGHHIILGRKNYESLNKPLPDRVNIVVTRNPDYQAPGCVVVHSLSDALAQSREDSEVFIFGGAELYAQALGFADRMHLTLVHADVEGDVYFPTFDRNAWREIARERHEPDEKNPYAYTFLTLERIAS
jgi:dihydrofolate reductase